MRLGVPSQWSPASVFSHHTHWYTGGTQIANEWAVHLKPHASCRHAITLLTLHLPLRGAESYSRVSVSGEHSRRISFSPKDIRSV